MSKKEKRNMNILFVCPYRFSTFMRIDYKILKRYFNVKLLLWRGRKEYLKNPLKFLILLKYILWCDVTFSWFADFHAFLMVLLSKLFRKKSIVIIGGFEVAKEQRIDYGAMLNPNTAKRVKFTLDHADRLLTVSKFSTEETKKCTSNNNITMIYNGIDVLKFKRPEHVEKKNQVITIASTLDRQFKTKGIETFIETARLLPEINFKLVGSFNSEKFKNQIEVNKPSNLKLTSYLPNEKLIELMSKSKVYCQLSWRESFGVSLAESMACECVPVVTKKGAIPEVVGNTGFYVPYGDHKATAEAIEKALKSKDKGEKARKRVKERFSLEKREKKLIKILKQYQENKVL